MLSAEEVCDVSSAMPCARRASPMRGETPPNSRPWKRLTNDRFRRTLRLSPESGCLGRHQPDRDPAARRRPGLAREVRGPAVPRPVGRVRDVHGGPLRRRDPHVALQDRSPRVLRDRHLPRVLREHHRPRDWGREGRKGGRGPHGDRHVSEGGGAEVSWDRIRAAREKFERFLLGRANVVGVGVGKKVIAGKETETPAVMVFVEKKLPEAQLKKTDIVPKTLDDVKTDVVETGRLKAQRATVGEEKPRTARWRPAPGGGSIGHVQITAGTLGGLVRDGGRR